MAEVTASIENYSRSPRYCLKQLARRKSRCVPIDARKQLDQSQGVSKGPLQLLVNEIEPKGDGVTTLFIIYYSDWLNKHVRPGRLSISRR